MDILQTGSAYTSHVCKIPTGGAIAQLGHTTASEYQWQIWRFNVRTKNIKSSRPSPQNREVALAASSIHTKTKGPSPKAPAPYKN